MSFESVRKVSGIAFLSVAICVCSLIPLVCSSALLVNEYGMTIPRSIILVASVVGVGIGSSVCTVIGVAISYGIYKCIVPDTIDD